MEPVKKESARRLFFSLWPEAAGCAALAAWQPTLGKLCGGKPMRSDMLHCTLVFLGEVAESRLEAVLLAAQEVRARRFVLELVAAHYWEHNRIVYAAPATTPPPLAELVSDLEQSLRRHRFDFEERPYKPHVTLLRSARWGDEPLPPMPAVRWPIADFALVQSLSDGRGARYEVLARFGATELE